jgi:hypothetical protein
MTALLTKGVGNFQLHYNLMEPLLYMGSIIDQNIVMQHMNIYVYIHTDIYFLLLQGTIKGILDDQILD